MVAKLTLLSSKTTGHPMTQTSRLEGFSSSYPEPGRSLVIWYSKANDSAYLRTTPIVRLSFALDNVTGKSYTVVETANSTYRMDVLTNRSENEEKTNQEAK